MNNPRRFKFRITIDDEPVGEEGLIEIDQSVLDEALTEEWKSVFYDLEDEAGVASHIAWSMVIRGWRMSEIEGWLSDDDSAVIIEYPSGWNDFGCEAEEA